MDFKIDVFDTDITYLEGELSDDLRPIIEGKDSYKNKGITIKLKERYIIWVENPDDISSMVHESFHVVCKVLDERGIHLNSSTEEIYAYTLGYVINQIKRLKNEQKKLHSTKTN